MRHNLTADPSFGVRDTWEEALKVARKFWEGYDGVYDETAKQPFKAGEGYGEDPSVTLRKGSYLHLSDGDGPYICITRASK